MELSQEVIRQVALPAAAFHGPSPPCGPEQATPASAEACWQTSLLNPKNRIDSLEFPANASWRIDGCIAFGTQFYAVPLFLGPVPPQRVDVFIPSHAAISSSSSSSPGLCQALDLSTAFHTRETRATRQLGITRHIVRCLQHWTATSDEAGRYRSFPFGSRIVFHNVPVDVRAARISVAPAHHLERQMLSAQQLRDMWREEEGIRLPPAIDLGELRYKAQPHDSVSVVERDGETLVFKAVTSHTKYLYHELRQLLRMPPHPNVIGRPLHLVTKRCAFGAKTAVVGFTLAYHRHGSVRDHVPRLALRGRTTHRDEVRWALQLVRALRHFRAACGGGGGGGGTFYSDLRLDNVLLSDALGLVLVDFEQRGVWSEFAAPEINAIECLRELATDEDLPDDDDDGGGGGGGGARARYAGLLTQMLPRWEALVDGEAYAWPAGRRGYNVAWRCLAAEEQERCEVYMLGRVLWCLFEAQSAPQRAALWTSYPSEPAVEFPAYARTPPGAMRRLIDRCTEGHVPTLSSVVVRSGGKLVLRELEAAGGSTPDAVRDRAREFWTMRIADSERWVRNHIESRKNHPINPAFPKRPDLSVVEAHLEAYFNKL
ncbi:Tyrosine-protein kinase, active site protein [Cordyceps javanica]|uniref:Tyrosine-protein kinase, active site protein n=1 Tax=Cordyceps javanica TaxID=43265 RepID=A0A545W366_9HYPO|nr:Tyrosine-protein kinase, active site protein [Cordyceps javanica]TQW08431.1 Tyrosine-protein kinase, active site protein [Cordyceps javanica]